MLGLDSYIQHYFMQCVLKVIGNNYKEMNTSNSGTMNNLRLKSNRKSEKVFWITKQSRLISDLMLPHNQ